MTTKAFRIVLLLLLLPLLMCCNKRDNVTISSEADLAGLTVGVCSGSYYDMELSGRDDVLLERFATEADLIQSLRNFVTDVCVHEENAYSPELCKAFGVKIAFRSDKCYPASFAFRKEDTALRSEMDRMLEQMKEDGSLDSLANFWLDGRVDFEKLSPRPTTTEEDPLIVGCSLSLAPISFLYEGRWTGFECEILYRFGDFIGRPVKFVRNDYNTSSISLKNKGIDVLCGALSVTPEREEEFAFSTPYHLYRPAYYVRDPHAVPAGGSTIDGIEGGIRKNLVQEKRWEYIAKGLLETIRITIWSILLGSILGILLCWMSRSRRKALVKTAAIYNWFMSGIPTLVLLLLIFYVIFAGSGLSPRWVAIITFSLNFASGACGVFCNSLKSVPQGQMSAALALGFTRLQALQTIIIPQAARSGAASFKGQCIALLKSTSIVGYVGIQDLTRAGDIIRSRTFDALFPLLIVTVLYFILAWLLGLLLDLLPPKTKKQ